MTGITKAGPPRVRWALTQAAWAVLRCKKRDPMAQWAWEVAKRRGKKCAAVALVRKLSGVLYAMWRDGKPYDPHHAGKATRMAGLVANPIVP
jgi:transposase